MNLQEAIEIIKNLIDGVNCTGPQRRAIESAFAMIVNATKKEEKKKKVDTD